MSELKIAIVGLGYVGLPVALGLARKFPGTVGFDINKKRVGDLKTGYDVTGDADVDDLKSTSLKFTTEVEDLNGVNFFVVAVPTPIDDTNRPDLGALCAASRTVAQVIKPGATVVFESTVYPGVTEEVCGPVIAEASGLKQGVDFKLGYSPERINPGDKEHTLERIIKVVSGEDEQTLELVAKVYGAVVDAGVHKASSIKVAEAAKVIENTQRDLNIALMNELALIFNLMDINTMDVLEAAGTKWNFLKFKPGLVGGHCIGVDPFYLTMKAEQLGYIPQVILSGRRINDGMGKFVAGQTVKLLANSGAKIRGARVAVLGATFKENVSDIRNSRIPDIIAELKEFGVEVLLHDPCADAEEVHEEFGLSLVADSELKDLDGVVLAVSHEQYIEKGAAWYRSILNSNAVFVDVKSLVNPAELGEEIKYWSL